MPLSNTRDGRSSVALGWAWASHVTTISLEMVFPSLLGFWIDHKLGTGFVFLIVGAVFGMVAGFTHLIRFARSLEDRRESNEQSGRGRDDRRDETDM